MAARATDDKTASAALQAKAARAERAWAKREPRQARRLKEFDERRGRADARWNAKRRAEREPTATEPKTKDRQSSGQTTAVARGAQTLLTPVEHFFYVDGSLVYLGGTSTLTRLGPGRTSIALDGSIGVDERRAELVWAAAILYVDFLAIYRELRVVAPTRASLDRIIAEWPKDHRRAVTLEMLARGASLDEMFEACRQLPIACPPQALRRALLLAHRLGNGAHLLPAEITSLDLDEEERYLLELGVRHVRDLPERALRRVLARREQQVHVRRVPALPPERGKRMDDFHGTALADLLFAGHCLARRFSHVAGAPHRAVDIADQARLTILYREGPQKAAYAATAAMLGRSPPFIRRLVMEAKVQGLVVPENTKQAE